MLSQHALEQELSKKEAGQGAGLSATAQRAYVETLSESLSPHTKSHGPVRVDDVIRKNEVGYRYHCGGEGVCQKLSVHLSTGGAG